MDDHRDQDPQRPAGPADPVDPARTAESAEPADGAYARLRAADPAAGATLDTAALRAEVARRTGDGAAPGTEAGDAAGTPGSVTTLASRRRARWLQVAAVGVGAALVAGAGGYAVGASGDGPDTVAAGAIVLGSGASTLEGAADSAAATADMRIAPWFGGRAVFSASGLADDATSGHAWGFDAVSVFSAETAARVAAVLGVAGDPRLEWGSWTVGASDGSGPNLSVQSDGSASVSYYDPTRDPWSCTASATDTPDAGGATEGSASGSGDDGTASQDAATSGAAIDPGVVEPVLPTQPACDPAVGDAPTGDAAVARTRDVLTSLGVDPDAFEYEVTDSGTPRAVTVLASHVLDGQRTGLSWNVTLVGDGVQSLYGWLAPLVDLGEYPVVGAATAVERLNDPRFGPGSTGVMPLARGAAVDESLESGVLPDASAEPTVPPTAQAGAPIAWPVQQVTITGARLGLTLVYQADGSTLLVPAYELTGTDGTTWSVMAVDEGSLDLAG